MKRRLRFLAACLLVPGALLVVFLLWPEPLPDTAYLPPALAALGTRAAHGDAAAQYELSRHYTSGDGVPSDDVSAFRWCRAAARRGYAEAQAQLADMYFLQSGMPAEDYAVVLWLNSHLPRGHIPTAHERNRAAGKRWLRAAAEKGHAAAQHLLGEHYQYGGHTTSPDPAEAAKWYARAVESYRRDAAQGSGAAAYALGQMYSDGQGVPQDLAEAARWMKKGADLGFAEAQFNLANAYESGSGVRKDDALAAEWYFRAAEQGHPVAQWYLAEMYAEGRGVAQDPAQAFKLYRELADRGPRDSRSKLAIMYLEGFGVAKDEVEAWKWWVISRHFGDDDDQGKMKALEGRLTVEQKAEAERRADEYKAIHVKSIW